MSLRKSLQKAGWITKMALRTFSDAGSLKETTPEGIRTALKCLLEGSVGPAATIAIHAANHPNREAIVDQYRRIRYQDLVEETNCVADALWKRVGKTREPIALMLRNRAEFLILGNVAARLGIPIVYVSYRLKADEVAYILENSGAKSLFFEADLLTVVTKVQEKTSTLSLVCSATPIEGYLSYQTLLQEGDKNAKPPKKDTRDTQVIIYTSGTTGKPKGASRRVGFSSMGLTFSFLNKIGLQSDDRHLAVCPLYHSAGIAFSVFTFVLGGTVVLLEHFEAEKVLDTIAREKISTSMMVPTMYRRLLELPDEVFRKYDTTSLRCLVSGAAILPVPLQKAILERFGPVLYDFYGATETGWNTVALPEDLRKKPGTIGRLIEGNEIRLLDKDGKEVQDGEIGQVFIRSDLIIDEYHNNQEATDASIQDGFFTVGDLAYRDQDGYYFLAGRKHDMVISGGINIYPKEIEDVLHEHPSIVDTAVVGIADPEWGEVLYAFLVLKPGESKTSENFQAFCKERLANFKCPKRFYFIEEIPRNPTGKILKRELKQIFKSRNA